MNMYIYREKAYTQMHIILAKWKEQNHHREQGRHAREQTVHTTIKEHTQESAFGKPSTAGCIYVFPKGTLKKCYST